MRPRITFPLLIGFAHASGALADPLLSSASSDLTDISVPIVSDFTRVQAETSSNDIWSAFRLVEHGQCPPPYPSATSLDGQQAASTASSYETSSAVSEPTPAVDTFVSFEDWKRLKEAEEAEGEEAENANAPEEDQAKEDNRVSILASALESPSSSVVSAGHTKKNGSAFQSGIAQALTSPFKNKVESTVSTEQGPAHQPSASPPPAPHHNRYNYASPDCSARIHSSSPQTQHASSLLHKSRDRYMLTPCKAAEHWVVVELCDEIRIEALEVAVWEFFSGVVREVRVSVGGEDDEDEEQEDDPDDGVNGRSNKWKEVGAFVGKNVRGVQKFTLSQPTSFHRFIRLDFPSYFGTEYYCPVSQLKVYGMNQMEAFKWEQKRISAASKEREKSGNKDKERESEERKVKEREGREKTERDEREQQKLREKELDELEKLLHEQAGRVVPDILAETAILSRMAETAYMSSARKEAATPAALTNTAIGRDTSLSTSDGGVPSSSTSLSEPVSHQSETSTSSTTQTAVYSSKSSNEPSAAATATSTYSRSSPPKSDASESIYAFIIRRLNALEGNSTLVARYIEEQAKVMRQMLIRVERGWEDWKGDWEGEDRGRWEQERMRQEDRLGKVTSQFEQQRVAMEAERKEIQTQLRVLAAELENERRRGLAQLFVMFVIIVLGVITRSSTIDAVLRPLLAEAKRRRSMRKSFSGPLTGLRIDMGAGRPVAVIGQSGPQRVLHAESEDLPVHAERQSNIRDDHRADSPTSPTPNFHSRHRVVNRGNSTSRRPGTPTSHRQRRLPPSVLHSNVRSVSTSDAIPYSPTSPSELGLASGTILSNLSSPKPRSSLPLSTRPGGAPRKLARSAHLHTMEADKVRHNLKKGSHHRSTSLQESTVINGGEDLEEPDTPKRPRSSLRPPNVVDLSSSPEWHDLGISPDTKDDSGGKMPDSLPIDIGPSEWSTDAETEMSASEVEDEVDSRSASVSASESAYITSTKENEPSSQDAVVQELKDIWNSTDQES